MQTEGWVIPFLEHRLKPSQPWFCFLAFESNNLVGMLVVVVRQDDRLKSLGLQFYPPNELHSEFLVAPGEESEVVPALLAALKQAVPGYRCIQMRRLPSESQTLGMIEILNRSHATFRKLSGYGSYVEVKGTYEDYRMRFSRNFKKALKKARKKLQEFNDVECEFTRSVGFDRTKFDRFMNLESAGWKGKSGNAILKSKIEFPFYEDMVKRFSELGMFEWRFLVADGKTIAGHLAVKLHRRLFIIKIAYDEKSAFCAPGNMLFEKTLEHIFNSGDIDEIDCLTDMAWHRNWKMARRDYFDVWLTPKSFIPLLTMHCPLLAVRSLKKIPGVLPLIKRLRSLRGGE